MKLRHYQQDAKAAVLKEWESVRSTLVVLPTGAGKTILFASIIEAIQPKRAMVIAHREELIWQARDKIKAVTGLDASIEMADLSAAPNLFNATPVVVATVQTLNAGKDRKRMSRFNPQDFGCLIVDECFPAGTMVDGRPIEQIKTGEEVSTHNGKGIVTHAFKRPAPPALILVTLVRGDETMTMASTFKHPFWTPSGFSAAIGLPRNEMVLTITPHESLHNLRQGNNDQEAVREFEVQVGNVTQDNPQFATQARRRDHSLPENERHESSGGQGKSIIEVAGDGLETDSENGERPRAYDPATGISGRTRLGYGSSDTDKAQQRRWLSNLLQGGRWKLGAEICDRSGWELSLGFEPKGAGPEERCVAAFARVESAQIIEQGSGSGFEKVCPDGFVYNLEVSNGNTYFANGVLVHNCHHITADSYKNVVNYFSQNSDLKILAVTATPDRADEESLGQMIESVAFDYEILDAIHDGWLVPIEQQMVGVKGLDYSHIRTTAGDLNGADLAAVMEAEGNLQGIAGASIEIIGTRRAIVFASSVVHAELLCNIFNRHKMGSAAWVCGATPKDERRMILSDFSAGVTQIVCNVGVLTEGFDDPGVEVIVMGRPTKSRSLYSQIIGRSTRPLPGLVDGLETAEQRKLAIATSKKPHCLIVDFVGNSGRHKLVTSADILGGKVSDRAIDRAKMLADKLGKPVRMSDLLDQAENDITKETEERKREEERRKAQIIARVQYNSQKVNPFDVLEITPTRERGWDHGKQLSEKQRAILMRQGIDPDSMPFGQARQLLNEIFRRWNTHECTFGQAKVLKRFGVDTKGLPMKEASSLLDRIKANGWKLPADYKKQPEPQEADVPF